VPSRPSYFRYKEGADGQRSSDSAREHHTRLRMGTLPPRYSFALNPHVRDRFTKCPSCDASTRIRKLPLVVHVEHPGGPRLVLLNKTCRLCLICETLIVDRVELESIIAAGLSATVNPPDYVVLGTIDRRTWRRGLRGDTELPDIREHMADFKKYLKVDVVPAHWARSSRTAG
jgi:hypothetical protein